MRTKRGLSVSIVKLCFVLFLITSPGVANDCTRQVCVSRVSIIVAINAVSVQMNRGHRCKIAVNYKKRIPYYFHHPRYCFHSTGNQYSSSLIFFS